MSATGSFWFGLIGFLLFAAVVFGSMLGVAFLFDDRRPQPEWAFVGLVTGVAVLAVALVSTINRFAR